MIKTIKQIRIIQRLCQVALSITAICIAVFIGAILKAYDLKTNIGHIFEDLFVGSSLFATVLLVIIRFVRCPVCHNVYVGKQEPTLFTEKCRYCGRRSGDTG